MYRASSTSNGWTGKRLRGPKLASHGGHVPRMTELEKKMLGTGKPYGLVGAPLGVYPRVEGPAFANNCALCRLLVELSI